MLVSLCILLLGKLCVSKEEELKESFKGKDMTYEQYEQLKTLNESHGQGPKEDDTDTKDSPDNARRRCLQSVRKTVALTLILAPSFGRLSP